MKNTKQISVKQFAARKKVTKDAIIKLIARGVLEVNHPEVKECNKIGNAYVITLK